MLLWPIEQETNELFSTVSDINMNQYNVNYIFFVRKSIDLPEHSDRFFAPRIPTPGIRRGHFSHDVCPSWSWQAPRAHRKHVPTFRLKYEPILQATAAEKWPNQSQIILQMETYGNEKPSHQSCIKLHCNIDLWPYCLQQTKCLNQTHIKLQSNVSMCDNLFRILKPQVRSN